METWWFKQAEEYAANLSGAVLNTTLWSLDLHELGTRAERVNRLANRLSEKYVESDFGASTAKKSEVDVRKIRDENLESFLDILKDGNKNLNLSEQIQNKGYPKIIVTQSSAPKVDSKSDSKIDKEIKKQNTIITEQQNTIRKMSEQMGTLTAQAQSNAGNNGTMPTVTTANTQNQKSRDLTKIMTNWKILFAGEKGEDVRLFFRQIEEMKKSSGLTDEELTRGFLMLLYKGAETHFRVNATKFDKWENIKTHMCKNYTDELYLSWKQTKRELENRARTSP